MADVFHQIYIQTVFAVKSRKALISPQWEDQLYKYITGLVREIKKASNEFVKKNKFSPFHFDWQSGYGAFSYSRSHMDKVCKYILNQKEHHKKRTFEQEYRKMLADFDIEIGKKEMFDFFLPD
jgi:putative transposase